MDIRRLIRAVLREQAEGISFHIDHTASYHGQSNFTMYLIKDNKKVAYLDYTVFQGETEISMVEVYRQEDKRKGYGRALVQHLADQVGGYENIKWSMMTDDGSALRQAMDNEKGFDRKEYENEHYKKDDMMSLIAGRSEDAAKFFGDLTVMGYESTWKKWEEYFKIHGLNNEIDGIDLNDLSRLSEWTRGSVENNNPVNVEPDWFVVNFVEELSHT